LLTLILISELASQMFGGTQIETSFFVALYAVMFVSCFGSA
jgi:hypothetical protein